VKVEPEHEGKFMSICETTRHIAVEFSIGNLHKSILG